MPIVSLNRICEEPTQPDQYVWRFLTLAKLLDFITTKALFFSHLALAEDPYDGRPAGGLEDEYLRMMGPVNLQNMRDAARMGVFVSCWHLSEHEPASMWKLYSEADGGFAIRTTYTRLRAALDTSAHDIHLGLVNYAPEQWHYRPGSLHTLTPVWMKRPSFEHEKEVRAAMRVPEPTALRAGHYVDVPIDILQPDVVGGPSTPGWCVSAVERLLNQLGLPLRLSRSQLYTLQQLR